MIFFFRIQPMTRTYAALRLLAFLLLLTCPLGAQQEQSSFSHLEIKGSRFKQEARTLFEDSFGFLWIGTNNGLYRYDGNRVRCYFNNPFDSLSLANNTILSIVEDDQQNLWIASDSYLSYFDRRREVFHNFFKARQTTHLYANKAGEVWANVRGKGLLKIGHDAKTNEISFTPSGDRGTGVLIEDEFGRRWFGDKKGLRLLDEAPTGNPPDNVGFQVDYLRVGRDQSFWVASGDKLRRVMYFKDESRLETTTICQLPPRLGPSGLPNKIVSLCKGKEHQLWIGTEDGLFRINTLETAPVPHRVEDPTRSTRSALLGKINAITSDEYNNVWIGSAQGVVKIIERTSMFGYTDMRQLSASLAGNRIKAIFEDKQGGNWIGTEESGLYYCPDGSNKVNRIPLEAKAVSAIKQQRFGSGLHVAAGKYLFEVSTSGKVPSARIKYALDRPVRAEVEVSENEQWIGTSGGGLKIFNDDRELPTWKKELEQLTAQDFVFIMILDRNNNVWIGTRGNGLYKVSLDEGSVQHYLPKIKQGVTSNAFISVVEDGNGDIWFGTRGGGLLLYNEETNTFTAYTIKDGLPSNTISALGVDQENNLWLSTPEGIVVYRAKEEIFYTLTTEDGINESNFQYNSVGNSLDRQRLHFGTTGGYYTIRTGAFKPRQLKARTIITNLRTYGADAETQDTSFAAAELFDEPRRLSLPYFRNNVSIGFSSLDLTAPAKTKYAYQLKGINDYWIYPTTDVREAIYFDLPPGNYLFAVKSSNSDGVWNEEPATLGLKILPPFYRTNVAYILYALLALLAIWVLARLYKNWYRLRKRLFEEKISREKNQEYHQMRLVFFTDISHELRTPLTLILGTVENWLKRGGEHLPVETAQRVYTNGLKMKQLINQLLDVHKHNAGEFKLRVQAVDAIEHFRQITSTFTDHARMKQLELGFHSEVNYLDALLDRSMTDKIVGNLISNAIKYTPAGGAIGVTVGHCLLRGDEFPSFELSAGKYVTIVVEDNGIGMNEQDLLHVFDRYYQAESQMPGQQSGSGIGMELVNKLTRLHQGCIIAESESGVYTRFTVYLPVETSGYSEATLLSTATEYYDKHGTSPVPARAKSLQQREETVIAVQQTAATSERGDVLIVEDNEELRRTMVDILSDDYNVLEAANGKEAFESIGKSPPQVIVTDLVMPVEGGLSLIKRVRAEETMRHLPIFVLTAKSSDVARKECLEAGASDFIEKPFSMEFLRWKIRNSLEQQRSMRSKFSKTISVRSSDVELESPDELLIQNLIKLVEDNIENPDLSVQFLAHEIGMSRANLYRKLKSLINDTPVSFIKKIRLDRAKSILEMNKFYISEVAYMCGFNSRKYFTKCFQKAFGCSPSEYAELSISEPEREVEV